MNGGSSREIEALGRNLAVALGRPWGPACGYPPGALFSDHDSINGGHAIKLLGEHGSESDVLGAERRPGAAHADRLRYAVEAVDLLRGEVWLAETDTRHYAWRALGASEAEARAALLKGWRAHAADVGADPGYLTAEDVNVKPLPLGRCLRDETPMTALTFTERRELANGGVIEATD